MSILQGNSCSIAQKSDGIWTVQTDLQQIALSPTGSCEQGAVFFMIKSKLYKT